MTITSKVQIINIGVASAFAFWIVDSFIDALVFGGHSILESLVNPGGRELYMRIVIVFLIVGYSFYKLSIHKERTSHLEERQKLVRELKDALDETNKLEGMLPVCSSCKKVRDKGGDWSRLDVYLNKHKGTKNANELCPGCAKSNAERGA